MQQGDEGVGLAAAIGDLETQHWPAGLTGQAHQHIAGQLLHAIGGIGAVEEHGWLTVDRRCIAGAYIVEVGGELGQGQRAAAHIIAQAAELMPG